MPDGKEIVVNAKTKTAEEALDTIADQKLPTKTLPVTTKLNTSSVDKWQPKDKNVTVYATVKTVTNKYGSRQLG